MVIFYHSVRPNQFLSFKSSDWYVAIISLQTYYSSFKIELVALKFMFKIDNRFTAISKLQGVNCQILDTVLATTLWTVNEVLGN